MISCQIHDYIEIACLYGFHIQLQLIDDTTLQGRAITTETSADKHEWLVIEQVSGHTRVDLLHIKTLHSLTSNPYFDQVVLNP